jgi:hypothetical protein
VKPITAKTRAKARALFCYQDDTYKEVLAALLLANVDEPVTWDKAAAEVYGKGGHYNRTKCRPQRIATQR